MTGSKLLNSLNVPSFISVYYRNIRSSTNKISDSFKNQATIVALKDFEQDLPYFFAGPAISS